MFASHNPPSIIRYYLKLVFYVHIFMATFFFKFLLTYLFITKTKIILLNYESLDLFWPKLFQTEISSNAYKKYDNK